MDKYYLILFVLLVHSCQLDSDPRVEIAPDQLEIVSAYIAMDATFAAATLGLNIPAVILSCAGFGLARM